MLCADGIAIAPQASSMIFDTEPFPHRTAFGDCTVDAPTSTVRFFWAISSGSPQLHRQPCGPSPRLPPAAGPRVLPAGKSGDRIVSVSSFTYHWHMPIAMNRGNCQRHVKFLLTEARDPVPRPGSDGTT
jgi:hypothetical protein